MSDPTGSPGELERQIEQARLDLAQSVDAIVDRVHPKKVVQRSVGRLKERVGIGAVHTHPDGTVDRRDDAAGGGSPIRKEYLIAAAAVVAAGTIAVIVWRRRRS